MRNETLSVSRAETRKRANSAFHEEKMLWPETLFLLCTAKYASLFAPNLGKKRKGVESR
jgi:hypothetical protein